MAEPLKCDLCDQTATVHLTQIVNNQIHKVDLCESCAEKKGITDPNGYSLADMLVNPKEAPESAESTSVSCGECGYTQREFKKTGRLGCPDCYETFGALLSPALQNMHRGEAHKGKVPEKAVERQTVMDQLRSLEESLEEAIRSERYEDAARHRDEIIELKKAISEQEVHK